MNAYQQPVGPAMENWQPRQRPGPVTLAGRFCRLEPLDSTGHCADLYQAYSKASDGRDWTYMFSGPFTDEQQFREHLHAAATRSDTVCYVVIDLSHAHAVGMLALMGIEPAHGVIEVGQVAFSPEMKRTPLATEAHFLLMTYAFEQLGYRRYEWKCDSLNAPSRRAAERLGFTYEGMFRQAVIYKGRSRDTCWYAIIDSDWPAIRAGFERWLDPANFDRQGRQKNRLAALRKLTGS